MSATLQLALRRDAAAPARVLRLPQRRVEATGVSIITDRAGFDRLAEDWRVMEKAAEGAVIFQSFDWCRAVWDHHARSGKAFQPVVLTVWEQGKLVGVLPLQRSTGGVSRTVTGFGEPYQQYTDVLIADDAPAETAARLLEAACRIDNCEGLQLLKVRDDSRLATLLAARGAIRSNEDAAPFVDLRPFADFKSYHATVNAKTRKNMRNARNRLGRTGDLQHRVLTGRTEIDDLVTRAHEGRERWLTEQGLTSRAFRDPSFGQFARSIAESGSGITPLAMSLTLDGRPVADQWGFVFNRRYYAYVASWAPEFEESSPGKLHLEEVIRACHERGVEVADFLMPAARYKFTWTDQAMPVADYCVPLSLGTRLQFSLWSGHLRPFLKRLALRLPPRLRGMIARTVLPR